MPLMKGKSEKAFGHNVGAEMHAGKPQKQALAIAYAVKRRMGKKMAKGGMVPAEDMSREYFKPHEGAQMSQDNEDLNPMMEPEMAAMKELYGQYDLSKHAEEHDEIAHPMEVKEHIKPEMEVPLLSRGGMLGDHKSMVKAIMAKKIKHFDEGGIVESSHSLQDQEKDDDDYLSEGMPPVDFSHLVDEEDQDPKMKRKAMIAKILSK